MEGDDDREDAKTENLTIYLLMFFCFLNEQCVLYYTEMSNIEQRNIQIIKLYTLQKCLFPLSLFCLRCIPSTLFYSPPPHRHPLVLPGAGSGSEDQAWQHRGVELRLPTAGRHRGLQSDGECQHEELQL